MVNNMDVTNHATIFGKNKWSLLQSSDLQYVINQRLCILSRHPQPLINILAVAVVEKNKVSTVVLAAL